LGSNLRRKVQEAHWAKEEKIKKEKELARFED